MKKIISVFLSFIFCFVSVNEKVFAGRDNPIIEHRDLIGEFKKRESTALENMLFDPNLGIPVSLTKSPGYIESTYGSEYREIQLYNIPCLLDQKCNTKDNKSNLRSFLIAFHDDLVGIIKNMPKLQNLAKENRNNLDGFLNGAANILKGIVGEKLAEYLGIPDKLVIIALTSAVLWAQDKFGITYKSASALIQTLGFVSSTIGSYLIGNAAFGLLFGKAATAAKVVGETKEAIEKAKKAAEVAEAARKAGLWNKIWWGAGALTVGAGGIGGGTYMLTKDGSLKQKLLREQILNYSNFFRLLMEEITENKEKIMQSNLLVVAIDKREFCDYFYWNGHRKNHGAWISFETIKDLKCSPCANVCKTKDGYTMEKYIEEVTALLKGVDYKKYLIEFEEPKGNEIENGMEKEEKDVDKESMCVCF